MHGTLTKKNLCNQHNIHNLRVVEALLFLGTYGKSKNSQFSGIYLFIYLFKLYIYMYFLNKKLGGGEMGSK